MKISLSFYEPPVQLNLPDPRITMMAGESTLAAPSADLVQALMGFPAAAGKVVTRATAVRVASFMACVKMLSSDIAKYPLVLRATTTVDGRVRKSPAINEPLYPLLKDCPNQWHTSYQMRFFLGSQLVMNGNCFCQIIRDQTGEVLALNPLDAWRMTPKWDRSNPKLPALIWTYADGLGNLRDFQQQELWHTTNCNIDSNGVYGSTVIALAKEALSVLMAAEEAAGRGFANGLLMGNVITFPPDSKITAPQAQGIVDDLKKSYSGSQNAGKFTALPGGGKLEQIAFSPKDAQLLESRQFNERSIASLMGGACLVSKLGFDSKASTYASTSAFLEDYHNTSLLPHCTAIEQSIKRDLIDRKDWNRLEATHDTSVILAGSLKERAETYEIQFRSGQITGNEARILEDRDTVEGLDFFCLPGNTAVYQPDTGEIFIPAQDLGKETDDGNEPPTPAPLPMPEKKSKAAARLETIALSLVERVVRKEQKGGQVEPKFVAEVLNISLDAAKDYCSKRTSGELKGEDAKEALIKLVIEGANDE